MPRVERDAEVTLVVLVYRSLRWLDWCMEGVDESDSLTRYRWLIVANDATDEVRRDPRIGLDFRNDDPSEFYINRVYRAWNTGVMEAPTQLVCMLNSDMYPYGQWLDALMAVKGVNNKTVPTSLLIESGRLPSAMPNTVKNFGMNPDEFRLDEFLRHAKSLRDSHGFPNVLTQPGRLYMPILVDRQEFIDVGMYPEGNPPGTTGDKDLIRRYEEAGFEHVTAINSIVYHVQTGEQEWPK
jgi:hypothetical protein